MYSVSVILPTARDKSKGVKWGKNIKKFSVNGVEKLLKAIRLK
ncbi:MAG: hypothetical protein V1854_02705 [Methanobacteriota archaeon]